MNKLRNKWWLVIVVIIVGIGIYWFGFRNVDEKLESYNVVRDNVSSRLILSGETQAREHTIVRFQSGGLLSWVGVKAGDEVKKGQALASLDRRALKKSLEQKLNVYMATRWNFEQTASDNKDWEVKSMTDAEREAIKRIIDKSQFTLNNSVLDVELTDLSYQFAVITSPISGIVVSASPEFAGVNINPSSSGYEIVNPNSWYFAVSADQTEVVSIKEGDAVRIKLDAFEDIEIKGLVEWVSLTPDQAQTGSVYLIKVSSEEFSNLNGIKVGMTGDAEFVLGSRENVLVIPSRFYRQDAEGFYVLVNNGNEKRYIEIGLDAGDMIEVISGLSEGDLIYLTQ